MKTFEVRFGAVATSTAEEYLANNPLAFRLPGANSWVLVSDLSRAQLQEVLRRLLPDGCWLLIEERPDLLLAA